MKIMKYVNFFLILAVFLSGCQNMRHEDDDEIPLEEEISSEHLIGDPAENPQEVLISESLEIQSL